MPVYNSKSEKLLGEVSVRDRLLDALITGQIEQTLFTGQASDA